MTTQRSTLMGGLAAATLLTALACAPAQAAPAVQARATIAVAPAGGAAIETVGCRYTWHHGCWRHRVWRHHVWHYY
jgi:hypothetical protein